MSDSYMYKMYVTIFVKQVAKSWPESCFNARKLNPSHVIFGMEYRGWQLPSPVPPQASTSRADTQHWIENELCFYETMMIYFVENTIDGSPQSSYAFFEYLSQRVVGSKQKVKEYTINWEENGEKKLKLKFFPTSDCLSNADRDKPPCTSKFDPIKHLSQTISVKMNQSFGYIYIYISLIIEAFQHIVYA